MGNVEVRLYEGVTGEQVAKLEADLAEAEREAERLGPPTPHLGLAPGAFNETPAQSAHANVDRIRRKLLTARARLEQDERVQAMGAEANAAAQERQLTLFKALREHQHKYAYFLLTAAGAGIALAVNQTHQARLAWSQGPLAVGVTLWAASFLFGCSHLGHVTRVLTLDGQGNHGEEYVKRVTLALRRFRQQFWALVMGAAFYVGWHIWEMYLRGANAPRVL